MADPDSILPYDRLPEGFAERLSRPPRVPVEPRPAATVVLMRAGDTGPEVLLLKRVRSSGFVPGAFVFPGGRVDAQDGDTSLGARLSRWSPPLVARRLGLEPTAAPAPQAYLLAALREAFEETGILLARAAAGDAVPPAAADPRVEGLRQRLFAGEITFAQVLEELDATLAGEALEYIAHWITPEVEARRYDTRFFAAEVPRGTAVSLNPAEMTDHRWLAPRDALEESRRGALPMVFPTLKTLVALQDFDSPRSALAAFAAREIPRILPRLVRTPTGVGLELPEL